MRQLFFILTISIFLDASCDKEKLPEYYFKCKVNGQEYVPDNCANCGSAKLLADTGLIVFGNRNFESLGINIDDYPIQVKTYNLNSAFAHRAYYDNTIGNPSDIFRTDSIRTGQIIITSLDKTNKIIAGTFSFDAYNAAQNKTVKITDGKFRLQYKTN